MRINPMRMLVGQAWVALLVATSFAGGCSEKSRIMGQATPNTPPDTEIVAGPPSLTRTGIEVNFFWQGWDRDGQVDGFEWRISDNGPDGLVDIGDTLEVNLPWHFTTVTDSTFLVSADLDSYAVDVANPSLDSRDYRFWQTHTFFVRAVDDRAARDPSPASASFTATTLAPTVIVDTPRYKPSNTCVTAAQVLTFGWTAADIDGVDGRPEYVRHILLPVGSGGTSCLTEQLFRTQQPIRGGDPRWSPWAPYDAESDSGRIVSFGRQNLGDSFLFAVQAKDAAGAVTPTLDWGRNVRHVRVGQSLFPELIVEETTLGSFRAVGRNEFKVFNIVSGQPLTFRWEADASDYAGIIEAYRYGWNVADPLDPSDPGWALTWGLGDAWLHAPTREFSSGSPNLIVQCRDNSGTISRIVIQLQVVSLGDRSQQRNLLLVDDWPQSPDSNDDALERRWDEEWRDLLQGQVQGFTSADVVDPQDDARLNFALINQYKAVIWFTNASQQTYFNRIVGPRSRESEFNWLDVYQQRVGNLMFVGPSAMQSGVVSRDYLFPIIFDVPQAGNLGFGTSTTPAGRIINNGTLQWPYRAFCLEAMDMVRPPLTKVFGEPGGAGQRRRTGECDGLLRAVPTARFFEDYPEAQLDVRELTPTVERRVRQPEYRFDFEEFFDFNATTRPVRITTRPCQSSMFELRSRRDDGLIDDPYRNCEPWGLEQSRLQGAPVAVISRAYAQTKQLRGSEDLVWGFHPLAFDASGVRAALRWIFESRWELPIRR
jgi:hypothetical protein